MTTVSMKVATNPKFMLGHGNKLKNVSKKDFQLIHTYGDKVILPDDLKRDIINSVKFIIPRDLMNLYDDDNLVKTDINLVNGSFEKCESRINENNIFDFNCITESDYDKNVRTWATYGTKLPFPIVFLENQTGGILLKQYEKYIEVTYLLEKGITCEVRARIFMDSFSDELINKRAFPVEYIGNKVAEDNLHHLKNRGPKYNPTDVEVFRFQGHLTSTKIMNVITIIALQIISFINSGNIKHIHYKPTKKEIDKIPTPFKEKYEYTTIDIFRERKVYHSLEELIQSTSSVENKEIRAHIVRGHFKHKKNGVFWWNSFIRNNKGVSIPKTKDYVLHD